MTWYERLFKTENQRYFNCETLTLSVGLSIRLVKFLESNYFIDKHDTFYFRKYGGCDGT